MISTNPYLNSVFYGTGEFFIFACGAAYLIIFAGWLRKGIRRLFIRLGWLPEPRESVVKRFEKAAADLCQITHPVGELYIPRHVLEKAVAAMVAELKAAGATVPADEALKLVDRGGRAS